MNPYIETLNAYLAENKIDHPCFAADTLLHMLYCCYYQRNYVDPKEIHDKFSELDNILSKLSLAENNAVFDLTTGLCVDHQQEAFFEGIRVGFRIYQEITALEQ